MFNPLKHSIIFVSQTLYISPFMSNVAFNVLSKSVLMKDRRKG